MNKTIQERYKAGEKLSRAEMYEVVRWRIVYGLFIKGDCRDVGHTHQGLNYEERDSNGQYRACGHISKFNHWWRWVLAGRPKMPKGKRIPGKHGYYNFLVAHLESKGLNKWTRENCPEIVFKELDADDWTGHESGAREELWRYRYRRTAQNVIPGGTGRGRKRKHSGSNHFGCVTWCKREKTFKAKWTPTAGELQKYLLGSCSKDIKVTHNCLMAKWKEVKGTDDFRGMIPPKSLDYYKDHFAVTYPDDRMFFSWIV